MEFHDCTEVHLGRGGGSDAAGFVQVIQARAADPARSRELVRDWDAVMEGLRPEVLGTLVAMHPEGDTATQVVWFWSEAEAREGERSPFPPDRLARLQEAMSLLRDVRCHDLREHWLFSPR